MSYDHAAYLEYLASAAWQCKRIECLEAYRHRCFVCGYDFRQRRDHLEVNHTSYKNLRHEDPVLDLVPLCSLHHRPGIMTWELVRSWRSYYRSRKRWGLVWRIITWPLTAAIGRMRKRR